MAKKKSKKNPTRRRRRVGAMALNAKSPILMYGSMVLGYFLSDKINGMLPTSIATMDQKIVGGAEAGIGAALAFMKMGSKPKSAIEVGLGGILVGVGAKKLLKEFGIVTGIGGYQAVPVLGQRHLNGYGKVPVLGYATARQQLNGVFNGYQVPAVPSTASKVMGSMNPNGSGYNPE